MRLQLPRFGPSLRGVRTRAGSSSLIFVVAVVAVAGAAAGPIYYSASQESILHDSVAAAPVIGRGIEVVEAGAVGRGTAGLQSQVADVTSGIGGLFRSPVLAVEGTAFDSADSEAIPLVSRTGVCAQLRVRGSCPAASGQVMISASLATVNGWKIGRVVTFAQWGPLSITGIYTAPSPAGDYWFDRAQTYFIAEYGFTGAAKPPPPYDAMFTVPATFQSAPPSAQGNLVVDSLLDARVLKPSDVATLQTGVTNLVNSPDLQSVQAVATSEIPVTTAAVRRSWSSLEVPLVVITLQLLVLSWLVLFLLVGDAAAARGPDVALAKLRGFGGWRTTAFGLAEAAFVVVAALPLGCLCGWAASSLLGHFLLRTGTPTGFPVLAAGTALAATAAGIAAVVLAAARTLRRPVIEQWRRADRDHNDRAWVLDVLLLTAAAAGLADLVLGGQIDSAHHSALSLLVPGLLGLAVAVVASRLLPLLCRAVAASPAGRGIAAFLALRHVARRPGGARTTILLATSFALATFAVSAWSVERTNYSAVAGVSVGAPTVLTVNAPQGADLGALVARADPRGSHAAAADVFTGTGTTTLAVDPGRWVSVASFPSGARQIASRFASLLAPPTAAPLVLDGDAVRLSLSIGQLSPAATSLTLDVTTPTGGGTTPVQLGVVPQEGDVTLSAPLAACPCQVQDLTFVPDPSLAGSQRSLGQVTVRTLEVHGAGGWRPVDAGLQRRRTWQPAGPGADRETIGPGAAGLAWSWALPGDVDATVAFADRPQTLPAIATSAIAGHLGPFTASGLDGRDLPVEVVGLMKALPGLGAGGVVVDRHFAEEAAAGNLSEVSQQVWVAQRTSAAAIESSLRREGVAVVSRQTSSATAASYRRAGPGLAGVLFLAEAAAAALLAGAGAILGLAVSARRRRYEMASLEVTGISARTLARAVLLEQMLLLGFGVAVGIASGIAADALVLRALPEFPSAPAVPVLTYAPSATLLVAVLAAGAAGLLVIAGAAGAVLVRGTRLSQLREGSA